MKKLKAEIVDRRGKRHLIPCEQLIENVMVNPVLPDDFDHCPNDQRTGKNAAMWNIVYIQTYEDNSPRFVEYWGGPVRYDVRRLDGGAWDRSTNHGQFGSLTAALTLAKTLFMDHQQPATSNPPALRSGAAGQQPAEQFRTVKATVPSAEMGAVQWAAKRCLRTAHNGKLGAMPLADFLREALLEKVRAVVRAEIDAGRNVPADIAAVVDEKRKII
jgi:hypothetical protein